MVTYSQMGVQYRKINEAMKIIITLVLDLSVIKEDSAKTNKVKLTKYHHFYL